VNDKLNFANDTTIGECDDTN